MFMISMYRLSTCQLLGRAGDRLVQGATLTRDAHSTPARTVDLLRLSLLLLLLCPEASLSSVQCRCVRRIHLFVCGRDSTGRSASCAVRSIRCTVGKVVVRAIVKRNVVLLNVNDRLPKE